MINPRTCLVAALAVCFAVLSATATDLESAERNHRGTMAGIRAKYDKQLKALPGSYVSALGKYEAALKKKGDLDGVLAFRKENARFKQAGTVDTEALVDTPETLRKVQLQYVKAHMGLRVEKQKRLLACAQSYTDSLASLEKDLTKKGDIDGALKVREKRNNADYSALEFELAEATAEAERMGINTEPDVDRQPPKQADEDDNAVAEWEETGGSGAEVHDAGTKLGELDAEDFKDITRKLKLTARSRRMKYPVAMVAQYDVENVAWRTGLHKYRFEVGSRTSKPLAKPMLVVDHFVRTLGRNGKVSLHRTDTVKLRNFSAKDKVIVDTKGVTVRAISWWAGDAERPDGWRPPFASGTYVGSVITIFDGEEQIVYQVVTDDSLQTGARDEMPEFDPGEGEDEGGEDDDRLDRRDRVDRRDWRRDDRRRRDRD